MAVKLYHPAGAFFSQCQFKVLTRLVQDQGAFAGLTTR